VTSDEGVLEITHESLARAWPRLRGWLEDDVEGQRIRHHLSGAADAWDTLGRPDSELYRGVRLTRALDWADTTETALTDTEHDFLDAARAQAEIEAQSAAERARAQARLIRRLRIVLGGAVVLLVLALAAGGLAAVQSDRASDNAMRAEQAALSADARRVGARAQLTEDISLSLLLAAAGSRLDDSPETRVNLVSTLAEHPMLVRSAPPGGGHLNPMAVSPDGRWIAASDEMNRMHLYDASTSRLLRSYDAGPFPEDGPAWMIGAFSPDSRQLAVIMESVESTEPVRLLDPNTMQPTAKLEFPDGKAASGADVQFSADGHHLAATLHPGGVAKGFEENGYALVWDLRFPSTRPVRVPTGFGYQGMALSPDGQILYTAEPLTAYDLATGGKIWERPEVSAFNPLDLNSKGTLLAHGIDAGKNVFLVDAASGETVRTLRGHRDTVRGMQFSPDGTLVGSVSADGELIIWDTATGRLLDRWDTFDASGVGFSPDNDRVYGGYGPSMLRTWDLSAEDTYLRQTTQVGGSEVFVQADLSPNGQQAAYRWLDDHDTGWVRFVDTLTGETTTPTPLPTSGRNLGAMGTWHPHRDQYVGYRCDALVCGAPGIVTVLDSATGQPLRDGFEVVGGDRGIWSLAYVDEGRHLLVGGSDGRTLMIEAETLRPRGEPVDVSAHCCITPIGDGGAAMVYEYSADATSTHWRVLDTSGGEVLSEGDVEMFAEASVASPDGATVAVAGDTGQIVAIDVSSGDQQQHSTSLGAGVLWLNYSDDGELLVSGAQDGGVSLWDAATLELRGTVYPPHQGEPVPSGAQFIGDTHDVVIASYDGTVYRWDTDLDRAIDFACQMAGRDLTEAEWAQYLPAQPYESVCPQD
jgi:WD40 repeat protein